MRKSLIIYWHNVFLSALDFTINVHFIGVTFLGVACYWNFLLLCDVIV